MIQTEELKQLLDVQNIGALSLFDFFIALTELIIINYLFTIIYRKYSTSLSNRNIFSYQFLPFSVSIFLIVFTIKSSLVLSLGLVGALSIIRFRTAVKENEQIISLLYLTGVSISLAASQFLLPMISSFVIFSYFFLRKSIYKKDEKQDNVLIITIKDLNEILLDDLVNEVKTQFKINISLLSIEEKDGLSVIVLKWSEINLKLINFFKSICKRSKLNLIELKIY